LACGDVVPHIVVQSPRPRLGEFETHAAKRLLQHYLPNPDVADIGGAKKSRPKAASELKPDDRRSGGHQCWL
jgi:hypothetical protein